MINAQEKFSVCTMNRAELIASPFNPRLLSEQNKSKLRANLKRVGLLRPLVFNKRTGHLVSGHQRLSLLDALENRADYTLDVAVVDLSEKEEQEQIVFFNNPDVQGTYDFKKLRELLLDVDIGNCGFQSLDLKMMLPEYEVPLGAAEQENLETVQRMQAEITKAKQKKKKGSDEDRNAQFMKNWGAFQGKDFSVNPERGDLEYFSVVVFETDALRNEFMRLVGATEIYIDGQVVGNIVQKGMADDYKAKKWQRPAEEKAVEEAKGTTGDANNAAKVQDGNGVARPVAGGSIQPS